MNFVRIYRAHFLLYIFFQIVFGNDTTIKFNKPDSIYISNKLDSLINKSDRNLNREYFLKNYGENFSDIQYELRQLDKIIDTIVIINEENIIPKYLNRIVGQIPKRALGDNFFRELDNSRNMIINKYYFITSKPDINIGKYIDDRLGMVIDLEPQFTSHFSGVLGAVKDMSNRWNLNGELDMQLENLWNTMESFSFFWKKLDSTNQAINLQLTSPHFFDNGMGINSYYKYDLVDGLFTELQAGIDFEIASKTFGSFFLGYSSGKINTTSRGKTFNYKKSIYKSLSLIFKHDSYNRRYLPDRGKKFILEKNIGKDTFDNNVFYRFSITSKQIFPLHNSLSIAFRSWNQYINSLGGVINPARKIRYGGINTLRGFMDNQFRSDKISIQTLEIHLQNSPFFRTLLFFDLGLVPNELPKSSLGFGINKLTKKALFELQYAIPRSKSFLSGKIHFKWTSRL